MRDPLWRVKTLPWIPLIQNALLTVLLATVLDVALLFWVAGLSNVWPQGTSAALQGGLVGLLLQFMVAGGIGVLAVILMERVFRQVRLDAATLWALVGCLVLVLFVKKPVAHSRVSGRPELSAICRADVGAILPGALPLALVMPYWFLPPATQPR